MLLILFLFYKSAAMTKLQTLRIEITWRSNKSSLSIWTPFFADLDSSIMSSPTRNDWKYLLLARYLLHNIRNSFHTCILRFDLQHLIPTFSAHGIRSFAVFCDINEGHLDEMGIHSPEERAKLLTAAQMISDFEGTH